MWNAEVRFCSALAEILRSIIFRTCNWDWYGHYTNNFLNCTSFKSIWSKPESLEGNSFIMDSITYHGTCICEGVSFNICRQPEKVFMCYCTDCQKNAGGPYQIVRKPSNPKTIVDRHIFFINWNRSSRSVFFLHSLTEMFYSVRKIWQGHSRNCRKWSTTWDLNCEADGQQGKSTRNSALNAALRSGQCRWARAGRKSSCGRLLLIDGG